MFSKNVILHIFLIFFYSEFFSKSEKISSDSIQNVFESVGFSPTCVTKALSICEQKSSGVYYLGSTDHFAVKNEAETTEENYFTNKYPKNCADILKSGDDQSGIREIFPFKNYMMRSLNVFCDQESNGGGWTVFQYRNDYPVRENFLRKWTEYKLGFGNLSGEFWLGLDNIYSLVSDSLMELQVELEDYEGNIRWAKYDYFYIYSEIEKYELDLGDYSGDAGNGLGPQAGSKFTTKDQDNDTWGKNCAQTFQGAWWYKACHSSNINGFPYKGNHSSYADGINWKPFRGHNYSLKKTKMSIRPKFG